MHVGRCVAYGEGAAYLPLRQVLASVDIDATLANVEDGDVLGRRASALVGLEEGATSVDEGFWAVRRIFDELASQRPLVIVLEDVHWAEAGLLELVDALVAGIRGPLLLLCTGRELPAAQPGWQENVLSLEPLSVEQTEALVLALNRGLAPAVQRRLVELAEGNPFYAEQLLAYVEELGSAALDSVPPSVESLLAARLDLLETEARSTAARAALIGREFSRAALSALSEASAPALSTHVLELVRGATSVRPPRLPTRSSTASVTRCSETSRTRASRKSNARSSTSRMATGWARPRTRPTRSSAFTSNRLTTTGQSSVRRTGARSSWRRMPARILVLPACVPGG